MTADNEEREQRILDTAVHLFVHYGYDKTTVSDIAREAGVSKGAIYLHFDSKDALFEALLKREMTIFATRWLDAIEADAKGGTIGSMYKNLLYALDSSPFMAAMYKQDGRVLGTYLRKPNNFFRAFRSQKSQSNRYLFVRMMQEAGAMRQDIDAKIIAYIMDMFAYSLVGMNEIMPPEAIPPLEEVVEGIATLMDRALTPDEEYDHEIGKKIVRQIAQAGRQQLAQMRQSKQE